MEPLDARLSILVPSLFSPPSPRFNTAALACCLIRSPADTADRKIGAHFASLRQTYQRWQSFGCLSN